MHYSILLLSAALLSACAPTTAQITQIASKQGKRFFVSCNGGRQNMNQCLTGANTACPSGYKIADRKEIKGIDGYTERSIVVECE